MVDAVGIVTGRPKDPGCIPGRGKKSRPAVEPTQPSRGMGTVFTWLKRAGCEAVYSPRIVLS